MRKTNASFAWGRTAMACAFSAVLAFQSPAIALATTKEELQQQMQDAREKLAMLNSEAEIAEYDLINVLNELEATNNRITQLDEQIPQTREELDAARGELAKIVSDIYKAGTPSLLEVMLGSASFDDFVSLVEYANRVSQHKQNTITEVNEYSTQLEQQKAELEYEKANKEELVKQQEERVANVEMAAESVQNYYNSLSTELQDMIAEEEAAAQASAVENAREGAAQAQRLAETTAQQQAASQEAGQQGEASSSAPSAASPSTNRNTSTSTSTSTSRSTSTNSDSNAGANTNTNTNTYVEPTTPSTPIVNTNTNTDTDTDSGNNDIETIDSDSDDVPSIEVVDVAPSADVSAFVARAYSIIGAGYQYSGYTWTGSIYDSAFTCSGVVDFARGLPSRSSSPETLYAEVGSRLVMDTRLLQYGDLVFYSYAGRYPGHVGIYIGGGSIIDSIPNGGVSIRDVDYMNFIGGGPIY